MNKQNILRVAKTIEDHARAKEGLRGVGFNMDNWCRSRALWLRDHIDDCSTVACIAGWAYLDRFPSVSAKKLLKIAQKDDERNIGFLEMRIPGVAAKHFGLDKETAADLFGWNFDFDHHGVTALRAVAVLRHLATTGKVNWKVKIKDYVTK